MQGCAIGSKPVGDDGLGHEALVLEQFPEQFQRSFLVPAFLDKDIENLALPIDRPPHIHPLAREADDHLVEMPHAIGPVTPLPNVGGDGGSELVAPASDSLVGYVDAAFRDQIFDISQAHRETVIEPDGLPDNVGMKAMTLERKGLHSPLFSNAFLASGEKLSFA